jgi:hypothetical protein
MKRNPDRHERPLQQRTKTTLAGPALVHVGSGAATRPPVAAMSKWQMALMGVGTLLAAMLIIWLGSGSIGYSSASRAISMERRNTQASRDDNDPRAMEANRQFMERARAMEAGFKAAFLFHR